MNYIIKNKTRIVNQNTTESSSKIEICETSPKPTENRNVYSAKRRLHQLLGSYIAKNKKAKFRANLPLFNGTFTLFRLCLNEAMP